MSYADIIIPEFTHEMHSTRKVLERVPEDKLDWRPHPKSQTIGWNASHLADLPCWTENILTEPSFDLHPPGGKPHQSPILKSSLEILTTFDKHVSSALKILESAKDDQVNEIWVLLKGAQPISTMPRHMAFRSIVISHMIHHRAILCVYLRLNDIPVPGMYGPSGD